MMLWMVVGHRRGQRLCGRCEVVWTFRGCVDVARLCGRCEAVKGVEE